MATHKAPLALLAKCQHGVLGNTTDPASLCFLPCLLKDMKGLLSRYVPSAVGVVMGAGRTVSVAGGNSETCIHWRKSSLSVQYPEATSIMPKTICRVPGQIEVLKSFQGKWGPRGSWQCPTLLSATQSKSHQQDSGSPNGTPAPSPWHCQYPQLGYRIMQLTPGSRLNSAKGRPGWGLGGTAPARALPSPH